MSTFITRTLLAGCCLVLLNACDSALSGSEPGPDDGTGSLFILGGGSRPPEMVRDLCELALEDTTGTIFIFPHASGEPDTSYHYAALQFMEQGYHRICNVYAGEDEIIRETLLDSVRSGRLIYLTGGDQSQFMEQVAGKPLWDALKAAVGKACAMTWPVEGAVCAQPKGVTMLRPTA